MEVHAHFIFFHEVGNHLKGVGLAAWHETKGRPPPSFYLKMETPTPLDDLALVTKARAADLLSVTVRTVERMVESGDLQKIVLRPKAVRITTASLKEIIQPTTKGKNQC